MQFHMLLIKEVEKTIPSNVVIKICWDDELFVNFGDRSIIGKHVLIEGENKDVAAWLSPFDGVPMGVGSPQLQHFEIMHVKELGGNSWKKNDRHSY